ncbi:uncharacterized protein LOC122004268 [Zingiber officinale]|uniref:uncharacterized protein LOC122004268 n=1 Tax=Zingiber officinale TaxID=94328 RepID=UPI001C4BF0B9|nr:uncharacterized protein LOC122004268 [Zingiber officinale]
MEIHGRSGRENLVADHLSRIEGEFDHTAIVDEFPNEHLFQMHVDYVSKFRVLKAIISNQGSHFYNRHMKALLSKYGVAHMVSTPYHYQTNRQIEVSNREVKAILEKTVGPERKDWSKRLDDALWAYRTAFKIPIGMSPYRIAVKACNFDASTAGEERKLQLQELEEIRLKAYENSRIYKEKTKNFRDKYIVVKEFKLGEKVLLYKSRLKLIKEIQEAATGQIFKMNGHRLKKFYEEVNVL